MDQSVNQKRPSDHQTVMPYLVVEGADKLIDFLSKVFDAKETERVMRGDDIIGHAQVVIGGATVMMSDATANFPVMNAAMYIYVDDADKRFHLAMENGAQSLMEPYDEDYGARGAGIKDIVGNTWWLATLK